MEMEWNILIPIEYIKSHIFYIHFKITIPKIGSYIPRFYENVLIKERRRCTYRHRFKILGRREPTELNSRMAGKKEIVLKAF